jgi:hypothetical protein
MATKTPEVQVVGLRALSRDIGKMTETNGPLLKALQQAARTATEPVAVAARGSLPQDTGRLAGDVRVSATRSGAAVRMGRASIRYAGWVEFGGTRKTPHLSSRPYQSLGRYLFPAALQLASTVGERYEIAIKHVFDDYRWTNTGTDPAGVHD